MWVWVLLGDGVGGLLGLGVGCLGVWLHFGFGCWLVGRLGLGLVKWFVVLVTVLATGFVINLVIGWVLGLGLFSGVGLWGFFFFIVFGSGLLGWLGGCLVVLLLNFAMN